MDPRREAKPSPRFLLNSVDLLGREIDPAVLSVAQESAPRAVSHGEKLLGDPALATSLFEEAAATVSKTINEKEASGKPRIRDMRGYLFRAYLRRISVERKANLAPIDSSRLSQLGVSVLRKWEAGHVVFTDTTAPLANEGSVPTLTLAGVSRVVMPPTDKEKNNKNASGNQRIDRQRN